VDPRFSFEVGSTLCWQITVVIAATFALQHWVQDARAGCRLWSTCFFCMIGLVAAALLLPHRRLFDFPLSLDRQSTLHIAVWQTRLAIGIGLVWGGGAALTLLLQAKRCANLLWFLKHECQTIDVDQVFDRVGICVDHRREAVCQRFSYSRRSGLAKPRLVVSDRIPGPFCWQLHRPLIALPKFMLTADDVTLRHVLLHELEHLNTQHPLQHFLQGVCSTMFWFHPLVWSAANRAELTREFLCDEVAANTVGNVGAYLRSLATVAERCLRRSCTAQPQPARTATLAFGNRISALIQRSNRLVRLAQVDTTHARWRSVVALFALLLCAGLIQQVWLPTNAMASQRSGWSPWPRWTAAALHQINVDVRDFERFEERVQLHELLQPDDY
jgi:hypothetical protein